MPPAVDIAVAAARRLVDPVLAVVFPSPCSACGRLLARPTAGPLCVSCWSALPRHPTPACRCGRPLFGPRPLCGRCRRGREPVVAGTSLGPYEGPLRAAIHDLKYRGRRRVAAQLASLLLEDPAARALIVETDVLVPVPLHPRRLRERGFNQASLIAREVGRRTGRRLVEGALVRRRETKPQAGLSAAARRHNVDDAFVVRRRSLVAGHAVTLIDDVLTTGATARACARALRAAGAREVRMLALARVV
jgi:ComF family protein